MGYVPINRPLHFPSKMVKATKPAAKPRKTARTEDSEEPDPTPKRSRTAPKTPVTVQEEESNVGQSPIPETTKKLYQEALKILPKIPKKNSTTNTNEYFFRCTSVHIILL